MTAKQPNAWAGTRWNVVQAIQTLDAAGESGDGILQAAEYVRCAYAGSYDKRTKDLLFMALATLCRALATASTDLRFTYVDEAVGRLEGVQRRQQSGEIGDTP